MECSATSSTPGAVLARLAPNTPPRGEGRGKGKGRRATVASSSTPLEAAHEVDGEGRPVSSSHNVGSGLEEEAIRASRADQDGSAGGKSSAGCTSGSSYGKGTNSECSDSSNVFELADSGSDEERVPGNKKAARRIKHSHKKRGTATAAAAPSKRQRVRGGSSGKQPKTSGGGNGSAGNGSSGGGTGSNSNSSSKNSGNSSSGGGGCSSSSSDAGAVVDLNHPSDADKELYRHNAGNDTVTICTWMSSKLEDAEVRAEISWAVEQVLLDLSRPAVELKTALKMACGQVAKIPWVRRSCRRRCPLSSSTRASTSPSGMHRAPSWASCAPHMKTTSASPERAETGRSRCTA